MNTAQNPAYAQSSALDVMNFGQALAANTDWGNLNSDSDWQPCEQATDSLFARLSTAYKNSGGFRTFDEVARRMERECSGDAQSLRRLVNSRQVIQVQLHNDVLLPVVQFEREDCRLKERVRRVVTELRPAFDDWAIAQWFIENNSWLGNRSPLRMIDANLAAVMEAARVDRFVAGG